MKRVLLLKVAAEMSYSFCAVADTLCVFSPSSSKCFECIRKAYPCDGNFSEADFDNLGRKKIRLKKMRTAALREIKSLDHRIKSLKKI
jgi:hypothetical protein